MSIDFFYEREPLNDERREIELYWTRILNRVKERSEGLSERAPKSPQDVAEGSAVRERHPASPGNRGTP